MRLFITTLLLFVIFITATAQQKQEQYSRAKIFLDQTEHNMKTLAALGVTVENGEYKKNTYLISDFSATELSLAKNAGFKVEIIIADVVKHYQDQNKKKAEKTTSVSCNLPGVDVPTHFRLGTYAGFYFYGDMLSILDSMQMLYPGLISIRQPIGTFQTIEGRPIYWVRISNNPNVDQPLKPQILYTAVHHAREPDCLSATIYYMWYLLERYSTDAHIKALIDNEEIYFVPCVNPDGYIYDSVISPTGGGMWRKNRRDNLDGTYGVDLNRNYGFEWGYDDVGSSPLTSSETYRGTSGFSEPETQAVKWFAENHHFKLNLNYHSFNNDIIYPWGYIASYQTNDSDLFFAYGSYLTKYNHYRYGTINQTLSYIANGGSDDWMYGDTTTKNKIFAMTPEVGLNEFAFYPPEVQILPDCQNNLLSNINAASMLLPFAKIECTDNKILMSPSGYIHFNLQKLGFPTTDTFTVSIQPLDSWMTLPTTTRVFNNLSILQQVNDSFSYTLLSSTPNNQLLSFVLKVYNGYYYIYDTVNLYNGKYNSVSNPSTSSLTDWINYGWGICTSIYHTPPSSINSQYYCPGNYDDNTDITISLNTPINLTHSLRAYLQFYALWGIESTYDYVMVSASIAGSGTWSPLCGKFTKNGSTYQAHNEPIYDGQQPSWVQEQMDLSDYIGQQVQIMYELKSDVANNYEGFFIDDIIVTTVEDSPINVKEIGINKASMIVSPNPASNTITISVNSNSISSPINAVIYDCTGREVKHLIIDKQSSVVDVKNLCSGIYYIKSTCNDMVFPVQKLEIAK